MNDPTELHEAASNGSKKLLEKLVLLGHYDVDSEDWTNGRKTPLHVAVERGHLSCVRVLLLNGADPVARTRSGMTPAHLAAENGDLKCLKALIGYDASLDLQDDSGVTPLRLAEIYGHGELADYLSNSLRLQGLSDGLEWETRDVNNTTMATHYGHNSSSGSGSVDTRNEDAKQRNSVTK
eukprot:gene4830-5462_t